jgi:hypothetical protein
MNTTTFAQIVSSAVLALLITRGANAANVSFSATAPKPGPLDIANLSGARTEYDNVNYGDHDAIYLADDRPIQGQTFTTGTNATGYQLQSITLREVNCETFCLVPDLKYTIRITKPSADKLEVMATEMGEAATSAPGNFRSISGGGEPGMGSGSFITFALEKPVRLEPGTTYGFDVSGGTTTRHYWQMDGTASNTYSSGTAYSILPNNKLKLRNGDHVFVLQLTEASGQRASQAGISSEKESLQKSSRERAAKAKVSN